MMVANSYGNGDTKILVNGEELKNVKGYSVDKDKEDVLPKITVEQADKNGNMETKIIKFTKVMQ